jgi:hypothetical protein
LSAIDETFFNAATSAYLMETVPESEGFASYQVEMDAMITLCLCPFEARPEVEPTLPNHCGAAAAVLAEVPAKSSGSPLDDCY